MKILIVIGHPAHVHFFKNLIFELQKTNIDYIVLSGNKEISSKLLEKYKIKFIELGSLGKNKIFRLLKYFLSIIKVSFIIRKYKPDIAMGIAAIRVAIGSIGTKTKTYVFTDTEHAKEQIALFKPFATKIFTPDCFINDLGPKQVRYPGYHELAYLHPNRFTPNPEVLKEIGLTENDKFFVVRFVSWEASHDIGQKGLSIEDKRKLIETLKPHGKIIISSEKELPAEFEEYRMNICPTKMHDLLYYATLLYGESATMSSECAVLGTHSIYIDFAGRGYTDEQEKKYDLVYNFKTDKESINRSFKKLEELLNITDLKEIGIKKRSAILKDKIDVTEWMIDLIKNESNTNTQKLLK